MKTVLTLTYRLATALADEQKMTNVQLAIAGATLVGMIINCVLTK